MTAANRLIALLVGFSSLGFISCAGGAFPFTPGSPILEKPVTPFPLNVPPQTEPLTITSSAELPRAVPEQTYSITLKAANGLGPKEWSMMPGSPLPNGLALDAVGGTITGKIRFSGTAIFSVQVTDSSSPPQRATKTFSVSSIHSADIAFAAPIRILTSRAPMRFVVADINEDGRSDIAYADGLQAQVVLSVGDTYSEETTYLPGFDRMGDIQLADATSDGKPDLICVGSSGGEILVSVRPGTGHGSFGAPVTSIALPAVDPAGAFEGRLVGPMESGDFNNDGHLDVVVSDHLSRHIGVLLGDGAGAFRLASLGRPNSVPAQILTGDLDRDGYLDYIVVSQESAEANVYLGYGDGTFQSAVRYINGTRRLRSGQLADMNGDGILDLVVSSGYSPTIEVLVGNGDGSFTELATVEGITYGGLRGVLAGVADLNGDGQYDLITHNLNGASVLLSKGRLEFASPVHYPTSGRYAHVADVNGDNKLDIIAAGSNFISVLFGEDDGSFDGSLAFDIGAALSFPNADGNQEAPTVLSAAVADLDSDGLPDIAVGNTDGPVRVLKGVGDGSFRIVPGVFTRLGTSRDMSLADLNRDGLLDAVFLPFWQLGKGDATFDTPNLTTLQDVYTSLGGAGFPMVDFNSDRNPYTGVLDDFSHDGLVDIAVVAPDNTFILLGNEKGILSSPIRYPTDAGLAVTVADVDRDGELDIVRITASGAEILYGIGNGNAAAPVAVLAEVLPESGTRRTVAVGDLNQDGNSDLVLTTDTAVILMTGDGVRNFAPAGTFLCGKAPGRVTVIDVNRDGLPDLVIPNTENNGTTTVTIMLNKRSYN